MKVPIVLFRTTFRFQLPMMVKIQIDPRTTQCDSCDQMRILISLCSTCLDYLCDDCDAAHRKMRCFVDHKVVQLTKPTSIVSTCDEHHQSIEFFCLQCGIPLCAICLKESHQEHSVEDIHVAETRIRQEMSSLMFEAAEKMELLHNRFGQMFEMTTRLKSQHSSTLDAIQKNHKEFQRTLDDSQKACLIQLEQCREEIDREIQEALNDLKNYMLKMDEVFKAAREVMAQPSVAVLNSISQMISQFEKLLRNSPRNEFNFKLTFNSEVERMKSLMNNAFGNIRVERWTKQLDEFALPNLNPELSNVSQPSPAQWSLVEKLSMFSLNQTMSTIPECDVIRDSSELFLSASHKSDAPLVEANKSIFSLDREMFISSMETGHYMGPYSSTPLKET